MFGKSTLTFDRSKLLGTGAYGMIFEGQWRGIPVAVKRVMKNSTNEREESTLLKLNHRNVIKLFHIDSDQDFKHYVLELCEASLDRLFLKDDHPEKYRGQMPQEIEVLHQLAIGLEYIHQMKLIHRNIKPGNVLIWVNPVNKEVVMKWSGFGLSKEANERGTCSMSGIRGTSSWFAPELLLQFLEEAANETEFQQRVTVKSDVFAEGLVFGYFLLKGLHLFGSRMQIETNTIENNPVNLLRIQEKNMLELIKKMLTANPVKRISSSDVVQQLIQIMIQEEIKNPDFNLEAQIGVILPNQIIKKFDKETILGRGDYGKVFLGEFHNEKVAVKRIKLSKVKRHTRREELQRLNHRNVVQLLYVEDDPTYRYYAMELCAASLDQLFSKNDDHSKYLESMPPAEDVLYQLAIGLYYIHETGLIHRDIKPQNVLFWTNPTTNEVVMKWGGLRLSKGDSKIKKNYSTNDWLAPELLKLLDNGDGDILIPTVKSNVFAQGLVFGYYLLRGQHLFGSPTEIVYNIRENKPVNLPRIHDLAIQDLIKKIFEPNPEKRMTSSDVAEVLEQIRVKDNQINIPMADDTSSLKQIKVDFKKELGRGGYGTVFQGEWNNIQVAVKIIPLSDIKQEEEALQKLKHHPNVIRLFHVESDLKNRYYAIELCVASLDKLFLSETDPKKYRGPMPSRKDVLLQLATGLEYIHKENVIHLDITPKNIVIWVNPENTKQVLLKWTDFGLSKQLKETGSYTVTKIRGAEGWFAPEILKILDKQQQTSRTEAKQRGTVKSDVFNEGLVFGYYLLKGRHLFAGLVESNIYHNKPVNLEKIEWQSARDLIKKMIHPDPEKRISSSDVAKEVSQIKSDLG